MNRIFHTDYVNRKIKIVCLALMVLIILSFSMTYLEGYKTISVLCCGDNKEINNVLPIIYAITPTYYRLTQRADLTRLASTLRLVEKMHWIVVEDWDVINPNIYEMLNSTGLSFTYMARKKLKTTRAYIKGADQRNAALDWIMEHHNQNFQAVFYFVDDDNTYSPEIFEQLRYTKKLSMWPVGLSGGRTYETPVVRNGKVTHFSAWMARRRKFPMDMAGFALNVKVLWEYHPMRFNATSTPGVQETNFLQICCTLNDIEPLADYCTKILVWHTKTLVPILVNYDDDLIV